MRKDHEHNLASLREPSLSRPLPGIEKAFRLVVVPGFGNQIVRVVKTKANAFLVVIAGERDRTRRVYKLSYAEWTCLEAMVESAKFWRLAPL